ncbi:hypothetical protein EDC52_103448 [Biostraticola tofi]|uniref:Uncharacterized protein n=1 Tax=Biostraticola tofi TaxID=466109 RepID=A0A4R3Z0A3_9GAMM|nr:hypothetical protein EDC52_103448 [Biostraticola tofi]
MSELIAEKNRILWHFDQQTLVIEPWGDNSLRVRATCRPELNDKLWALLPPGKQPQSTISQGSESLTLRNGDISATVNCCLKSTGVSVRPWGSARQRRARTNTSAH